MPQELLLVTHLGCLEQLCVRQAEQGEQALTGERQARDRWRERRDQRGSLLALRTGTPTKLLSAWDETLDRASPECVWRNAI